MDKHAYRKSILKERTRLTTAEVSAKSKIISALIVDSNYYKEAQSIFCFIGIEGEPDTSIIIKKAFFDNKTVYVPRTGVTSNMEVVQIDEATYITMSEDWPTDYGIPVPPSSFPHREGVNLDVVLVPSLAIDKYGYRLGHGAGYYDRFAGKYQESLKRPLFVAVQFSEFLLDEPLPRESHDMKVDLIVTENGIVIPSSCA
jgi:5,10-methenyltetrahydrofolate synthetase